MQGMRRYDPRVDVNMRQLGLDGRPVTYYVGRLHEGETTTKQAGSTKLSGKLQEADWTKEKHVPVIECNDTVTAEEMFPVTVTIGKEIAHPNTTEHHIVWVALYFQPVAEKFPFQIGYYEFSAHGASVDGPNTSTVYTHHGVTTSLKTSKPGTLMALAYCNIHGLWQNAKDISVKSKNGVLFP